MTDIRTTLHRTTLELTASGSPSARLDAEVLLMRYLRTDRLQLLLYPDRELSGDQSAGFATWVERRRRGEPVAYILGEKEFWSLPFEVNHDVLIPRPETECLVEEVLKCCGGPEGHLRIIDIGTGSGAIAIALATELPGARVLATDVSPGALEVARRNAMRHGVAGRMEFIEGDLFASAAGEFVLIVSNPPYIPDEVYPLLPSGIRDFEPRRALVAGPAGADFHRRIIREGLGRLVKGGRIFLEIGEGQAELVEALFAESGSYEEIRFRKDYAGLDRVASARRKRET